MPPPISNDLTPEEARQKWCPQSKIVTWGSEPVSGLISNRGHGMDQATLREFSAGVPTQTATMRLHNMINCVADDCMWWYWTKTGGNPKGRCGAACCNKGDND